MPLPIVPAPTTPMVFIVFCVIFLIKSFWWSSFPCHCEPCEAISLFLKQGIASGLTPLAMTSNRLYSHAHCPSSAETEGGKAEPFFPVSQGMYERNQNTRSACAYRVSEGYGAAVDVHLCGVYLQFFYYSERLGRKCLVFFNEVKIPDIKPGLFKEGFY